jgi:hypothetical protein
VHGSFVAVAQFLKVAGAPAGFTNPAVHRIAPGNILGRVVGTAEAMQPINEVQIILEKITEISRCLAARSQASSQSSA